MSDATVIGIIVSVGLSVIAVLAVIYLASQLVALAKDVDELDYKVTALKSALGNTMIDLRMVEQDVKLLLAYLNVERCDVKTEPRIRVKVKK